jgi:hypothetical protein
MNEELVDELCTELQQLCTELEKVRAVSEENCGRGITGRKRKDINYIDRAKIITRPGQQDDELTGEDLTRDRL